MRVTINPSIAQGSVVAPPSKSMAHRMLICAGLAHKSEPCVVLGLEDSQDVLATIDCLNVLGAGVNRQKEYAVIYGIDSAGIRPHDVLPCRECGSTLRFFVPVCLLMDKPLTLTGSETLMSRPMGVYEDICRQQGLTYIHDGQNIHVQGRMQPGAFTVPGDVSSQFVSGLLFALPLMRGDSVITLVPPVESRPYINMTIEALSLFGVNVSWSDENTLQVPGNQRYQDISIHVEGDYSNAAFLEALNYLNPANNVRVSGLRAGSLQGDRAYQELFPLLANGNPTISLADCPDLGPVLMAVAAANNGATFTNCRRLSIKESNRGQAMKAELEKFGAAVSVDDDTDTIVVQAGILRAPTRTLDGHNDHRIVMALAVLATTVGGTIEGAHAVHKSFPSFFDRLTHLGIALNRED